MGHDEIIVLDVFNVLASDPRLIVIGTGETGRIKVNNVSDDDRIKIEIKTSSTFLKSNYTFPGSEGAACL